jgi:CubicO group peptidase (beta-lactamase class C family)
VDDPQPVTPDTVFPLASLSKTVAATAIMRLVEEGRVQLDAPVQQYITGFRTGDEGLSRTVTVRHLLTHTPGWEGQLTGADRGLATLEYFVDNVVREIPFLAPPGAVWSYNNAGFTVAGRLIEVVTGRDIHTALRELVFAPLQLSRSFTRMGDVVTHRFAQGHGVAAGGAPQVTRPFALSSSVTAGGVAMSIADLLTYAEFHLAQGPNTPAVVLSRTSIELMRAPQLPKAPTSDAIGISWHLRPVGGVMTMAHGGTAAAGHRLLLELVPERELAFAILTNHAEGWRLVEEVERATLRTYESVELRPNQPIVHRGINEVMTHHASPMSPQPDPAPYVGTYRRTPGATTAVRADGGNLFVGANTRVSFYGPDVAYAAGAGGGYEGSPYEFVRQPDGGGGWIRINGRIARKDG